MLKLNIAVFGGAGYSGRNIVLEATQRELAVAVVTRTAPKDALAGVTYVLDNPRTVHC